MKSILMDELARLINEKGFHYGSTISVVGGMYEGIMLVEGTLRGQQVYVRIEAHHIEDEGLFDYEVDVQSEYKYENHTEWSEFE